nr:PREDICTED: rap1 GTPase-activating protein 2-like [Lepisosteus oculatus]
MAGRQGGSAGGEQRRSAEVTGAVTSSDSTAHTVAGSPRDMEQDKARDQLFSRKRSFTFGAYGGVDKFICPAVNCRPETFEHSILDILDSPTSENKSLLSGNLSQKASDLFEIIEKLQGSRLDEQRCEFPPPFKFLKIGGPLPLVLPPKAGGYWIEPPPCCEGAPLPPGPETEPGPCDIMDRDPSATLYRDSFRHKYHQSFTAVDPSLGSLILSARVDEEDSVHVILRMKECSLHGVFHLSLFPEFPSAGQLAKVSLSLCLPLSSEWQWAPELIAAFDEHRISENFKFGVLYQREGQLSEEAILGNCEESEEFLDFLSIMGETVSLSGFTGENGILTCFSCLSVNHSVHGAVLFPQVSVTAREDVPLFGPPLPDPPVFKERHRLREFLLIKLINAEISCYRAERFRRLEVRTRSSLLESLQSDLSARSCCMLGAAPPSASNGGPGRGESGGSGGGFIENFKRAIRVRSHSFDTLGGPRKVSGGSPQKQKGPQISASSAAEKELER